MAVSVTSFCSYRDSAPVGSDAHTVLAFIKALKGLPFDGHVDFPVNGSKVRLESGQQELAAACFGHIAAQHLVSTLGTNLSLRLIPIPSRDAVNGVEFTRFPARVMAHALVIALKKLHAEDVAVADILRWSMPKKDFHASSNSRYVRAEVLLSQNLVVTEQVDPNGTYVLVDDVCRSGCHMRATKFRLQDAGVWVEYGVCAGRTGAEPDPLSIHTVAIKDID